MFGTHHLMTDVGFPAVRQHPCVASPPPSITDATSLQQVSRL